MYSCSFISIVHIYYLTAPNPPTDLKVRLITNSSILLVSWISPSGGVQPTEYIIYYEATEASDKGTVKITAAAGTLHQSISVKNNDVYAVKLVALFGQLPSAVVEAMTALGELIRT